MIKAKPFAGLILLFITFSLISNAQNIIWQETFNDPNLQGKGAIGPDNTILMEGVSKWSINVDSCELTASDDYFMVKNNLLEARDLDGTQQSNGTGYGAVWISEEIIISEYIAVSISILAVDSGTLEVQDFIRFSYVLDNDTVMYQLLYDDFDEVTVISPSISGNTLQIIIEMDNNAGTEYLRVDDITVTAEISIPIVTTWQGTENNNWHNSTNWSDGVPGEITYVTIPGNLSTYPTISSSASCYQLTMGSGTEQTATILGNGMLNIVESALIQKYITPVGGTINDGAWHLIGSPVPDATAEQFSGQWLNYWDEPANQWQNIVNTNHPLTLGEGFALKLTDAFGNLISFNGIPNQGNMEPIPLHFTDHGTPDASGWNLISNPYPSGIDWNLITRNEAVNHTCYLWDAINEIYLFYINGSGSFNGIISPMQGFFVQTAQPGGLITFEESCRTHMDNSPGAPPHNQGASLSLSTKKDKTIIQFYEESHPYFDKNYDARKLMSGRDASIEIYTTHLNERFALNAYGENYINQSISVGFKGPGGIHTIKADEIKGFNENILIRLTDNNNQNIQNLLQNPEYTFHHEGGDNPNRFMLTLDNITSTTDRDPLALQIIPQHNLITFNNPTNSPVEVSIYLINGQKVASFTVSGRYDYSTYLKGLVLIKTQSDTKRSMKKIILK